MRKYTRREIYEWYLKRTSIITPKLSIYFQRVSIDPWIKDRMEKSKKKMEVV